MESGQGVADALRLLVGLDPELWRTVGLSLAVSGTAVLVGAAVGIPAGAALALFPIPGRRLWARLSYTLMGLPPILAGLVVFLVLSAGGPLGGWQLLFTPTAMILAQTLLVLPIITGLVLAAVEARERAVREVAVTLGATPWQAAATVVREARPAIAAACAAGFGRAIAEVGAVMLVGGNIRGHTRVMTTALLLETRQGNFDRAMGLGLVLLVVAFAVNALFSRWQEAR